jgi:nicotinate-nucleotide pyrophosphorylase (carboxylating)
MDVRFPVAEAVEIVRRALDEDLGQGGDITTEAALPEGRIVNARLVSREPAVVAGAEIAALVCDEMRERSGATARVALRVRDGNSVGAGEVIASIEGDARNVLAGERVMLNIVARMCGIATMTRSAVDELRGLACTVADTRKTTPGLRPLEKYAVRVGGGENHRGSLDELVLIKDNHKELAGGIGAALRSVRSAGHDPGGIEVEVESLEELEQALAEGVGWVLLDNMPVEDVRLAVRRCRGMCRVEVSGGLRPGGLRAYAEAGADRLSLGALTHSVRAIDLSLEISN